MFDLDPLEIAQLITDREDVARGGAICVQYTLRPCSRLTLEEAAAHVAVITTQRMLQPHPGESSADRFQSFPRVGIFAGGQGQVVIGYPQSICTRKEGLAQLLAVITAGAEYDFTDEFWVDQIELPDSFLSNFKGPKFGVSGIRRLYGIANKPLLGLVIKPRYGVALSGVLSVAEEALQSGVDFLADDLLLTDPDGELAFRRRVPAFIELTDRLSTSGSRKGYFCNISSSPKRVQEYSKFAQGARRGGEVLGLMVNGFTMGFGAVEEFIHDRRIQVPVIATNMGVGIMARPGADKTGRRSSGVSEAVISRLSRIAGADGIHTGTANCGFYARLPWHPAVLALRTPLGKMETSFAVAEGDLTVANLWDNILALGHNVLLEVSSGILAYPGGVSEGTVIFRKVLDAVWDARSDAHAQARINELREDPLVDKGLDVFGYGVSGQAPMSSRPSV